MFFTLQVLFKLQVLLTRHHDATKAQTGLHLFPLHSLTLTIIIQIVFVIQKTKCLELKRLRWIVLDEADRYMYEPFTK